MKRKHAQWRSLFLKLAPIGLVAFLGSRVARAQEDGVKPPPADSPSARAFELNQEGLRLFNEGKFVEAARAFEKALKLVPDNEAVRKNLANSWFQDGAKLLDSKEAEAARERFRRAIGIFEKVDQFHLFLGIAALQLQDDNEALAELKRAIELNPKSAVAHYELGVLHYRASRVDDAIAAWEAAVKLGPEGEPAKAPLEKARRERDVEGKFLRDRVTHFEIAYDGDRDPEVSTAVLDMLEDAYYRVCSELSHYPSTPTSVVLYSQKEFSSVTGSHAWVGGLFDGTKIRIPVKDFARQKATLPRTIRHEFTHVVVASLSPACPTWLNEGLAQFVEEADVAAAAATLREAAAAGSIRRFSALPPSFASVSDPKEVKILYAQSYSFVRWLQQRYGSYSFTELLKDLARTKEFEKSFRGEYHDSLDDLEQEWRLTLGS